MSAAATGPVEIALEDDVRMAIAQRDARRRNVERVRLSERREDRNEDCDAKAHGAERQYVPVCVTPPVV